MQPARDQAKPLSPVHLDAWDTVWVRRESVPLRGCLLLGASEQRLAGGCRQNPIAGIWGRSRERSEAAGLLAASKMVQVFFLSREAQEAHQ